MKLGINLTKDQLSSNFMKTSIRPSELMSNISTRKSKLSQQDYHLNVSRSFRLNSTTFDKTFCFPSS